MRLRAHESGDRSCKALLPLIAVVAAFVWVVVPFESTAAITVEPPTGSADPAAMDELQVALETVVAEAAAEIDGVFRISAEPSGDDLAIVVGLASSDGTEIIRESRVASRASAAAQVRAMARAAIRELTTPETVVPAQLTPAVELEIVPDGRPDLAPPEKIEPAKRQYPKLDEPYNRRNLVGVSTVVTLAGGAIGGGLMIGAGSSPGLAIAGGSINGLSLMIGPAIGHFRIHNNVQGALGLVGRTLLVGGATSFFVLSAFVGICLVPGCGCGEDDEESCEEQNAEDAKTRRTTIGLGIGFELAALTWAIIDLATIPRAVQRANEKALERKEAEQKISAIAFAPLFVPGPNGSTTTGLALSMRF